MKSIKVKVVVLLLALSMPLSAQNAPVAPTDATEQNLRKTIEYLASDKFEGRRTGDTGATDAAAYIANAFAKIKLKPGVSLANG